MITKKDNLKNVMIDFIKDLVEEAKVSDNHTAVKHMLYGDMMDALKMANRSFENFCNEISEYMEKNRCSFSCVVEGTMGPVFTVNYHGFESDNKFNSGGIMINADVNGSLNIMRLGIEMQNVKLDVVEEILRPENKRFVFNPVRICA